MSKYPHVVELANAIKPSVKIDPETGIGEVTGKHYIEHLPDGITEDTVTRLNEYDATFAAAVTRAVGEVSVDLCAVNKDLAKTTVTCPMGGQDKLKTVFNRTTTRPGERDEKTGERPTITTHADMVTSIDKHADHHVGALRESKEFVKSCWQKQNNNSN